MVAAGSSFSLPLMVMVERLRHVDEEPRGMVYGFIPRGIEVPVARFLRGFPGGEEVTHTTVIWWLCPARRVHRVCYSGEGKFDF
jgi:hypothetical protein